MEKLVNGGGNSRNLKRILLVFLSIFMLAFGSVLLTGCGETETAEYHILLLDEDQTTVLYNELVAAGAKIEGVETPTKASDAEYTYTFAGWIDEDGNKFIPSIATKDVTAYATYTATEIEATEFTVLLLDEDKQTVLYAKTVEKGATITDIETPTKAADETNSYTFAGWVDENGDSVVLAFIDHNITAYASYTATQVEYSLTILANEAVVSNYEQVEVLCENNYLTSGSTVHYGDKLQITVNGTEGYEITGYVSYVNLDKVIEEGEIYYVVKGDVTISYTEVEEEYTVMFYDSNGDFLASVSGVHYGESVVYDGDEPTKTADSRASYEFDGWVDADGNAANLKKITGDSTFYANYKETYFEYSFSVATSANSTIAVYKNSEQIYSGSTVHFGDTLTVVVTPNEGYYLSALSVNGSPVSFSGNQASVTVDSTEGAAITYEVEIYKFTVTLYNGNSPTSYPNVEYGTALSSLTENPTQESTSRYNYSFACWVDDSGKEVTYVKTNLVAYASYDEILIEYSLSIEGYAAVTLEDDSTYTSANASNAVLYYGDTFTVTTSSDLPDGYSMKSIDCVNATEGKNSYTIDGNVTITLYITRTYVADAYSNLQVFEGFANAGSVVYDPSACTLKDGFYFYTYTGIESIEIEASYASLSMTALNYTSAYGVDLSHTSGYKASTYTWTATLGSQSGGKFYTDYLSVPLYQGMTIEFTYYLVSGMEIFGLATAEQISDPASYGWSGLSSSAWSGLFVPTYNVYASGGALNRLTSLSSSSNGSSTSLGSTLTTSKTYTVTIVLGTYVEIYITNGDDVDINLNSYTSGWTITEGVPYYLTFMSLDSSAYATITSIGYSYTIESLYLESLAGQEITLLGDSITAGAGTTWDEGGSTANRYSTVLATSLGMSETNKGSSGTVYCTGHASRASRISDVASLSTSSKIVTVLLGTNDFDNATSTWATLGEFVETNDADDLDTETMYGAIQAMCLALLDRFGSLDTKVYLCTTVPTRTDVVNGTDVCDAGWTLAELAEVEKEVAAYYGISVIDLYGGIEWISSYFGTDGNGNLHPSQTGHAVIAEYMYDYILNDNMYDYVLQKYGY